MARQPTPPAADPASHRAGWDLVPHPYAEIEDDRIVLVNLALGGLLGRPAEALEGARLYDHVHPEDIAVLASAADLSEAQPLRTTVHLRRADATYVRVLWSGQRSRNRWHVTAIDLESIQVDPPGGHLRDGERALPQAERLLGFGTFETDVRTDALRCSGQLMRMAGRVPRTITEAESMLLPDDRVRLRTTVGKILNTLQPRRTEFQWMSRGTLATVEAWLFARVEDGIAVGVGGIVHDLRPHHLGEQRLERQSRLLDAVDAAVVGLDLDGRVIDWNTAAQKLYGWNRADAAGRSLEDLVPAVGRARSESAVLESLRQRGSWEGDVELEQADGTRLPLLLRESLVPGPEGVPAGRASIAVDLSARVSVEQRLEAARGFASTVTEKMADGVFTLDVDGGLTYMNQAAERLLGWRFAELRGRSMHAVAHYRHADGRPYPLDECPITTGRRESREVVVSEEVFIRRDGTAMPVEYTCSPFTTDDGKASSVVVFRDVTDRAAREARLRVQLESLSWAGRVRAAMADDRLVVYGQPIVSAGGEVLATELLARMRDEQGVLVTPREFWAAAEGHGLLPGIDAHIVAAAGRIAAAGTSVAVNVAGPSMVDARYLDALRQAVEAARGVALIVEVPERAVLGDEAAAHAFLSYARGLGCRIALDGFGTGSTGFEYLQRLPVDLLKIDRELILDLAYEPASREVVGAIVTLAETLGLQTVAVGVEGDETLSLVRDLGVDFVQGQRVGAPRPLEPSNDKEGP